MDDAAIRATALSIAQNRTPSDTVEAEATKLYDWMIAREQPGEQCVIAANNKVSPQDNVDGVIASATADYAFLTGGDGTPVIPWPPIPDPPPPAPDPTVFGMNRADFTEKIRGVARQHEGADSRELAEAIAGAIFGPVR